MFIKEQQRQRQWWQFGGKYTSDSDRQSTHDPGGPPLYNVSAKQASLTVLYLSGLNNLKFRHSTNGEFSDQTDWIYLTIKVKCFNDLINWISRSKNEVR